jgi:hypothetical protein
VILIGTGDASHPVTYHRAGGGNPDFAQQLWRYTHRAGPSGRPRRGISTVIPSDLLWVGDSLYLHAIVNRGFGNVVWTEITRGLWSCGKTPAPLTAPGETWGELSLRRLTDGVGFSADSYPRNTRSGTG